MSDWEAVLCHANPRKVILLGIVDGKEIRIFLWPWRREKRRSVKAVIRRERVWKPE